MSSPESRILNPESLLKLQALASGLLLIFALIAQYGFSLHPCELCIMQRYPYALILALATLAFLFTKSPRMLVPAAAVCALLFFVDSGIATYHAGVELNIFPGPSGCSGSGKSGESIEELRAAILNAPLVSCDQPMASFLGLSMAAWNALAAAALGMGSLLLLRHPRVGGDPLAKKTKGISYE